MDVKSPSIEVDWREELNISGVNPETDTRDPFQNDPSKEDEDQPDVDPVIVGSFDELGSLGEGHSHYAGCGGGSGGGGGGGDACCCSCCSCCCSDDG